jgi:hypothetical protein
MVRILAVGVAVLLPAGVLSAAGLDPRAPSTVAPDVPLGLTGLGQASLLDEEGTTATTLAAAVPVAPAASAPAGPPSSDRPATSPTTRSGAATTTTTSPARSGPTTTVPTMPAGNTPAASSWQEKADGISARLRMDPAVPAPGQPVRFSLDFTGLEECCYVFLHFGDGDRFTLNTDWMCQGPSPLGPGSHSAVATHTYAKPGAYWAHLQVMDGDLCAPRPEYVPGDPMPFHNLDIHACIAVGQRAAEQGCEPRPPLYPFPPPPGVPAPTATR